VSKKFLALLIAGALFLNPIVGVWAAVKNGSSCKKIGATATAKQKTYVCVKEKKKSVWRPKAMPVATPKPSSLPTPAPSATETPAPTPTPTPTPSTTPNVNPADLERLTLGTNVSYRLNNGVLERRSDLGLFFNDDSRDASFFSPIRAKAYDEIAKIKRNPSYTNTKFDWDIRPNFPTLIEKYNVQRLKEAAAAFDALFQSPITINVLFATEKDVEYVSSRNQFFSDSVDQLKRLGTLSEKNGQAWITGGGGYYTREGRTEGKVFLGTPSWASANVYYPEWIQVASHEYFHVVQQYFQFPNVREYDTDFNQKVPQHFREGSANFIGYALSSNNLGWYSDAMDVSLIRYWRGSGRGINSKTEADMISLLRFTESRNDPRSFELGYPIGAVFWEWVVGTYGYDKFTALMREFGRSPNFNESTTKILGLSKEELYKNSAPYLLSVFNRAINN
jgi:hypothetical protein